ncbi:hypothetical protein niasHT_037442 [Heterodera trifolii]|uniref:Uncharacterized protein n=1 Tax=Heterodera trifolii TaxID=157864 RepID=A0ABD2IEE5_9BILA
MIIVRSPKNTRQRTVNLGVQPLSGDTDQQRGQQIVENPVNLAANPNANEGNRRNSVSSANTSVLDQNEIRRRLKMTQNANNAADGRNGQQQVHREEVLLNDHGNNLLANANLGENVEKSFVQPLVNDQPQQIQQNFEKNCGKT